MGTIAVRLDHFVRRHSTRKGWCFQIWEYDPATGGRSIQHTYYHDDGKGPAAVMRFSDVFTGGAWEGWWNSKSIYGGALGLRPLLPLFVEALNSNFNFNDGGGTDWYNIDVYITPDGKVYVC